MRKASTELLEQGTQTPSPAADLIFPESKNQLRTHFGIGSASGGTSAKPVAATAGSSKILDRHLVSGIAWMAAARWSSQLLSWASLLIAVRLLSPSDFGLVGMAAIYLGLVQNFSEFGFGLAIITLRDLTYAQVAQINAVALCSGVVGFGLSCAVARPLGEFFHSPELPAVVVAMSSTFILSGFRTVPYSLLQREMQFKLLSTMEALQTLAYAVSTLAFAALGLRYWALVLGNIVNAVTASALPFACRPHGFARPRFQSIRHPLRFTWHLLVTRLSWYGYSNADFLVAGRLLGKTPLGAYTLAWNFATTLLEKTTSLVTGITPPFFSAVQNDRASLRRYLRTLTEALALITFPGTIGLGLVAPEFVHLALGPKWEGVVTPLRLLAFYATFRSITTLLPQVLTALGETRFVMWNTISAVVLLPTVFFIGSRWGTGGIACGWLVGYPFVAFPLYRRTFRRIEMQLCEYLAAIRAPLNGCVAMVATVLLLKWALNSRGLLAIRFSLEALAGATAYTLVMLIFYRNRIALFWAMIKSLRK